MGASQQPKRYTSDEFYELVKDKRGRYELIDGVIYSLSDPEVEDGVTVQPEEMSDVQN